VGESASELRRKAGSRFESAEKRGSDFLKANEQESQKKKVPRRAALFVIG